MKVAIIDTKRRLVLPGAKPGETYAVRQAAPGHYELAKVIPAPRPKPTAENWTPCSPPRRSLPPMMGALNPRYRVILLKHEIGLPRSKKTRNASHAQRFPPTLTF